MYREIFERLVRAAECACHEVYGDRLTALAVFGSVARETMRPDSDIDLLIVADRLCADRAGRLDEFDAVDRLMEAPLRQASLEGVNTCLSPVFRTPGELAAGGLLFLDMVEEARILHDPQRVLRDRLDALGASLRAMGARRVRKGGGYYWELKPDFRWGDRIEL